MESHQDQIIKKQEDKPHTEQEPLLELDGALGEIDTTIQGFDGANLTLDQKSRLEKIKGNIAKSTKKFLRATRKAVAIGAIIGSGGIGVVGLDNAAQSVGYEINQHTLEEATGPSGETIYTHPDKLTTHYLNILAGRDKFTEEDLKLDNENDRTAKDLNILAGLDKYTQEDGERIQREYWIEMLKNNGLSLPANIEKMSFLELITLNIKDPRKSIDPEKVDILVQEQVMQVKSSIQKRTSDLNERAELLSSMSKDVYSLVWQLEKEAGNPRIRLDQKKPGASYSPSTNTVHLKIMDLIMEGPNEPFMAEMSHGKQFKDNPLGSYLRNARDQISDALKSGLGVIGFGKQYDKLYRKLDSIEYQAHRVIQPDLENRYPITPELKKQKDNK